MEIKNNELSLPPMRIEGDRLIGLPIDYYLIFLGSIHDGSIYFTVIVPEKRYYKSEDLISDALIATSIPPNQNLEFRPVNSFIIKGPYRDNWELLADNSSLKILGFGEEAHYGENHVPMRVLHSIFKREHAEDIATVQTFCSLKN